MGGEKLTVDEVSQIFYINKEIKSLQLELAQLREKNFYKPNIITDMPHGGNGEDMNTEYVNDVLLIENLINYSLVRLQYERKKIEEFISTIPDSETRLIVRLRAVNNMRWEDIGVELGFERTTVSKKFYKYFKENKDSHKSHVFNDMM